MKLSSVTFFSVLCTIGCAGSGTTFRAITELAPPVSVRLHVQEDYQILEWQPSQHENAADFAGYNVYLSDKSLVFSSMDLLPTPVEIGKEHKYVLGDLDERGRTFIHVRSRDLNNNISLPSLPELIYPPE